MNDLVLIKVDTNSNRFINYLVYHDIKYSSLKKDDISYTLVVKYEDYKKIKRRYSSNIIRYYGVKYYKNILITHKYIIISFMIGLLLLLLLTNTIFDIQINTDDIELKNKIISILKKNDINVYKRKKSFNELAIIKEKILYENDDILEWIEISNKGCKYIVNLTPKITSDKKEDDSLGDIIAQKEGVIKHIIVHSGTKVKEENEYVKEGDILISGNILKNDEVINQVKAKGEVYAEVWYLAKVNIPFNYTDRVKTGKVVNHYYIELFNKKFTILGKYDSENTMNEKKLLVDKPYLKFKLYKEKKIEYDYKEFKLSEEEAYNEGLKRSEEYIKNTLSNDEYIISKNVLKKEINSSKMYLEVFYKVYESIGVTSKIKEIEKEELNEERSN